MRLLLILLLPQFAFAVDSIDTLDYFLQSSDTLQQWAWGGHDIRPCQDPDKGGARTYIQNKFNKSDTFEIFKITDTEIQIRYEILKRNYGRRFEENGRQSGSGYVWMQRFMIPGGEGFLSSHCIDSSNFVNDSYQWVSGSSPSNVSMYNSVDWAIVNWTYGTDLGFSSATVLRLTQEWQTQGHIFENYDYIFGKGIINWRWLENFNNYVLLHPYNQSAGIYRCENGYLYVQSYGSETLPPILFKCDANGITGRQLEVITFKSYWLAAAEWFVVYRDLSKESKLAQTAPVAIDMELPEWGQMKTIYDLPYIHTTAPIEKAAGDMNGDDLVNTNDLKILANQWLGLPDSPCADISDWPNGDRKIDFYDFAIVANDWQQ